MALITITGRPGFGKTLNMTNEARLNFKAMNPSILIWWTEKILKKRYIYTLNEYSNYPIQLLFKKKVNPLKVYYYKFKSKWIDKKENFVYDDYIIPKKYTFYDQEGNIQEKEEIYTWKVTLFDMRIKYRYNEGANFYIDEIQAMYDSMEYKDFPDSIAHFFQAHRHLDYKNIYVNSQSLSRIIKRVLVISEEYWNITGYRVILGVGMTTYKVTWELSTSKEEKFLNEDKVDAEYRTIYFLTKNVYKMYFSKYLHGLLDQADVYVSDQWDSLIMSYDDIMDMFFPTDEAKIAITKERY